MAGKVTDCRDCLTCGEALARYWLTDYCGDECRPQCDAEGCERVRTGSGNLYCRPHMSSIYKLGRLPERTWAKVRLCAVCGAKDWPQNGRRNVCSARCQQLASRHAEGVPQSKQCTRCNADIDLFDVSSKSGRKRRVDSILCGACRRSRYLRHGVSVMELFNRDGADCSLCGEVIDMAVRHPDRMCPTVDHVLPVSRGGSHDESNLALAHLTCNVTKQARTGWTPSK